MTLTEDTDLRLRYIYILELELEDLAGAKAVQQHQSNDGEIAKGAEAFPETGHLVGRERYDHASRLAQSQRSRDVSLQTAVSAVAKRQACRTSALEVCLASRNLMSVMKAIQTAQHAQAVIDGLRRGFGLVIELAANIVEQEGLVELRQRVPCRPQPTCQVEQVIGVSAQGAQ